MAEPFTSRDRRSFIELRHNLEDSIFRITLGTATVLEHLLIHDQISDYLVDVFKASIDAHNAFRIMHVGAYDEDLWKSDPVPTPQRSPETSPDPEIIRKLNLPKKLEEFRKRARKRQQRKSA